MEDCTYRAKFKVSIDTGDHMKFCRKHTLTSMRGWLQLVWENNRAVYVQRWKPE